MSSCEHNFLMAGVNCAWSVPAFIRRASLSIADALAVCIAACMSPGRKLLCTARSTIGLQPMSLLGDRGCCLVLSEHTQCFNKSLCTIREADVLL